MSVLWLSTIKVVVVTVGLLQMLPLLIWLERKGAAYFQDRRGPNRAHILGVRLGGLVHNVADVIKLMTKEDFLPAGAHRLYYILAPLLTMSVYFVTTAVIPFGDDLKIGDGTLTLRIADLNVGLLYILAMSSLAVYGIMLAGWSSNNKYSLLGGLRAASQMISYELALGLSVVSVFLLAGSADLMDIVRYQTPSLFSWNVFRQPLAFLIFLTTSFAETNRTPFDLPEGDSELVAGYHVEYSSMKFALFFMGEYAAIAVSSMVITSLFFGGWQVPFLGTEALILGASYFLTLIGWGLGTLLILGGLGLILRFWQSRIQLKDARDYEVLTFGIPLICVGAGLVWYTTTVGFFPLPDWAPPVFAAASQVIAFTVKVLLCSFFFIWVRWTVPRFRYDQLMNFGWKGLLPLAIANLVITGLVLVLFS